MTDTSYDATVRDGTLYIDCEEERIEIGSMDAIVDLFGGETYALEYTERQSDAAWLSTDEDGTITLDVREQLADWAYTDEFVAAVAERSLDETGESGYPKRTEAFVDAVTEIWDAKGHLGESAPRL